MAKSIRRLKELGPFQDLLLKCCPPDDKGRQSIPILARALDMTSCGVYKWVSEGHLPPKRVFELIQLSEGRVSWEEFLPYVFHKDAALVPAGKKRKR